MRFRSTRSRVLASNLSNADTPHFKARDLDFRQALSSQSGRLAMTSTHPRHIAPTPGAPSYEMLYRYPYQPSLDGNTVESEVEQAQFARNAVQYQASVLFLSGKISGLRDALTGGK